MTGYLDQNTQLPVMNREGLAGWFDSTVDKVKGAVQTGVDAANKTASGVISSAANEVKARAKEATVAYMLQHPNQVRATSAGAVIVFCGAIAGLLALGDISSKK